MANGTIALQALGDPSRRELFERLARKPLAVGSLSEGMPISRSAVSQHLKVLRDAGLVTTVKQGTRNVYRLDPRGVEAMRRYLDRLWDRAAVSFKDFAEREDEITKHLKEK